MRIYVSGGVPPLYHGHHYIIIVDIGDHKVQILVDVMEGVIFRFLVATVHLPDDVGVCLLDWC